MPSITDPRLCWKSLDVSLMKPPTEYIGWLLNPGSLTKILRRRSRNNFSVLVEEESWWSGRSTYLHRLLGKRYCAQVFWSRKVILMGYSEPWVVAHTLIPQQGLRGRLRQVKRLKAKPLGALLFKQRGIRRNSLDIVSTEWGWGRCSRYFFDGYPILVAEFFLPELINGNPRRTEVAK